MLLALLCFALSSCITDEEAMSQPKSEIAETKSIDYGDGEDGIPPPQCGCEVIVNQMSASAFIDLAAFRVEPNSLPLNHALAKTCLSNELMFHELILPGQTYSINDGGFSGQDIKFAGRHHNGNGQNEMVQFTIRCFGGATFGGVPISSYEVNLTSQDGATWKEYNLPGTPNILAGFKQIDCPLYPVCANFGPGGI